MSRMTLVLCAIIALVLLLAACKSTGQAKGGASGAPKAVCGDGVDNDKDGFCDWALGGTKCRSGTLGDTCCASASDKTETPEAETCNNLDDDCNGQVDDGLAPRQCGTTDIGTCAFGTQSCVNGGWGACTGAIEPVPEVCSDSLDNDCDGATDEGCPVCGDGTCDATESPSSCPADCGQNESDTSFAAPGCGDALCGSGESPTNCAFDCAPPTCGDNFCADSEKVTCPQDCALDQPYVIFNDAYDVMYTRAEGNLAVLASRPQWGYMNRLILLNLRNGKNRNVSLPTPLSSKLLMEDGQVYFRTGNNSANATNATWMYEPGTGRLVKLFEHQAQLPFWSEDFIYSDGKGVLSYVGKPGGGVLWAEYNLASGLLQTYELPTLGTLTPGLVTAYDNGRVMFERFDSASQAPEFGVVRLYDLASGAEEAIRFDSTHHIQYDMLKGDTALIHVEPLKANEDPIDATIGIYRYDIPTKAFALLHSLRVYGAAFSDIDGDYVTYYGRNSSTITEPNAMYVTNYRTGQILTIPGDVRAKAGLSRQTLLYPLYSTIGGVSRGRAYRVELSGIAS